MNCAQRSIERARTPIFDAAIRSAIWFYCPQLHSFDAPIIGMGL